MSTDADLDGSGSPRSKMERRVRDRMREVLDPCSCMTDSPVDIVELGLVETIDVSDGAVDICLVPTTPMCTYMTQIIEDIQQSVGQLESVDAVQVTQDLETIWTPERMSSELHSDWEANKPDIERTKTSIERQ